MGFEGKTKSDEPIDILMSCQKWYFNGGDYATLSVWTKLSLTALWW